MQIKRDYEIEAAWIRLQPHLSCFERGSDITDEWIATTGNIESPHRLEHRIRNYYLPLIEIRRRGNLLHLCTDEEQKSQSGKHISRARKQHTKAFRAIKHVDRGKLVDDVSRREADHIQRHALAQLESDDKYQHERKSLMGVPISSRPVLSIKSSHT